MVPSSPLGLVTPYGADTSDSGGMAVDPGGTVDTKGAYSELAASTTYPIKQLMLVIGGRGNTTQLTQRVLIDVAIGGAGSEQIVFPDIGYGANVGTDLGIPLVVGPYPVDIPAGTRLAVRAQSSINNATDRLFDACLYGVS